MHLATKWSRLNRRRPRPAAVHAAASAARIAHAGRGSLHPTGQRRGRAHCAQPLHPGARRRSSWAQGTPRTRRSTGTPRSSSSCASWSSSTEDASLNCSVVTNNYARERERLRTQEKASWRLHDQRYRHSIPARHRHRRHRLVDLPNASRKADNRLRTSFRTDDDASRASARLIGPKEDALQESAGPRPRRVSWAPENASGAPRPFSCSCPGDLRPWKREPRPSLRRRRADLAESRGNHPRRFRSRHETGGHQGSLRQTVLVYWRRHRRGPRQSLSRKIEEATGKSGG